MQVSDLRHVAASALPDMIDPRHAAVVVIDVQNDFAAPEALAAAGIDPGPIEAAIDRMEAVVAAGRGAGLSILFIRVITTPESDSRALKALYARKGRNHADFAIVRKGTPGADYYRLFPQPGDMELGKVLYDSFHGTDLHAMLRKRGIQQLIVTGMTTDCCVDQTVRSAFHHDYDVFVVTDAVCAYRPELHAGPLLAMSDTCALLTTSEAVIETLGATVPA